MKAPCCLLGAAALPRPPEGARGRYRRRWACQSSRISYTYLMSVSWVIVVMMMTSASAGGTQCPVRTDALDIESRAYVAPQVVEAVVQEIVVGSSDDGDRVGGGGGDGVGVLPGQPYTVTVSVSRVLRRYRGPSRVKKRATLTLTFRYPSLESDSENSGFDSDSSDDGECLVSASLRPRRKYILFLSGGGDSERGRLSSSTGPVPVASPELANKKLRRLVRKMVCKKCGGPPTVTGLRDDSVVRDYNLTLECTAQGIPAPIVHWYKDDILLTSSRNIKIRTRKRRRKMIIRGRGTRTPRHSPNPFLSEGFGRRRRIRRRRRGGGGGGGTGAGETEGGDDGGGGAAGTGTEKKRRIRGGRRREDSERRRITGRRRVVGGEDVTRGGRGGGGGGGPGKSVGGRRRRPAGRSHSKGGDGNNSHRRSGSSRNAETSNSKDSAISRSSSSSSSSSGSRRQPSGDSSRRSKVIISSLTVRGVGEEDEGVYKCVAKSVAGEATSQARIRVVPPIDPHPFVDKCPYAGYCLNGGTCMMFKIVGELVCQCADGFKGQRCQEKEVYPTFRRNCHGPLRHIRHSRGLRCPRNQPIALWELLQQSLARRQKVSPWTKTHFLSWPPSHTTDVYWPRYMPPAPHSFIVPQYVANQNGAPVHNGPHSTVSTLQQKASSKEVLHMHQTTQDPMLLDSLIPDLDHSQILRRKGHLGTHLKVSNSPVTHQQQDQTDSKTIVTPTILSTFKSPLDMKVKGNTPQNVQRNVLIGFPPTQPYDDDYREDDIVQLTYHHSQRPHRHHHQHHSSHNTDPPPLDTLKEIYTTEPTRIAWDQKVTAEVKLLWSSQMDTNTTPSHYLTMPNQDNLQQ